MNTNTGDVLKFDDLKKLNLTEDELNDWVEVSEDDMTPRQKARREVSLFDHRSTLGKQLTDARSKKKKKAKRRTSKKSRKKNRK